MQKLRLRECKQLVQVRPVSEWWSHASSLDSLAQEDVGRAGGYLMPSCPFTQGSRMTCAESHCVTSLGQDELQAEGRLWSSPAWPHPSRKTTTVESFSIWASVSSSLTWRLVVLSALLGCWRGECHFNKRQNVRQIFWMEDITWYLQTEDPVLTWHPSLTVVRHWVGLGSPFGGLTRPICETGIKVVLISKRFILHAIQELQLVNCLLELIIFRGETVWRQCY